MQPRQLVDQLQHQANGSRPNAPFRAQHSSSLITTHHHASTGLCASHVRQRGFASVPLGNRVRSSSNQANRNEKKERDVTCAAHSAIPPARGLYDPSLDKDACGVGFVAQLSKGASRAVVTDALKMLARMAHRGACGCEENTGNAHLQVNRVSSRAAYLCSKQRSIADLAF